MHLKPINEILIWMVQENNGIGKYGDYYYSKELDFAERCWISNFNDFNLFKKQKLPFQMNRLAKCPLVFNWFEKLAYFSFLFFFSECTRTAFHLAWVEFFYSSCWVFCQYFYKIHVCFYVLFFIFYRGWIGGWVIFLLCF